MIAPRHFERDHMPRNGRDGTSTPPGSAQTGTRQEISVDSLRVLVDRTRGFVSGHRRILGITGAPGAGKSTIAEALCRELGPDAVLVPLDGFHLDNAVLARLGARGHKGAAETFDAHGFVALLRRLRANDDPIVYAPLFQREIDASIAGAISVRNSTPLVIVEGNYLLLDSDPWIHVRPLLDECWYLDLRDATRRDRLAQRHRTFGRSRADAAAWVRDVDDANAAHVRATRGRADLVINTDSLALPTYSPRPESTGTATGA